jgi:hypothetical protein
MVLLKKYIEQNTARMTQPALRETDYTTARQTTDCRTVTPFTAWWPITHSLNGHELTVDRWILMYAHHPQASAQCIKVKPQEDAACSHTLTDYLAQGVTPWIIEHN